MSKRVLSLTLTLIMVFGIFTTSALAADDKPSSWAEKEVTAAVAAKLVPQSLQSKYTQATTRAEFCALAVTLYENIKGKAITERKTFADTKDVNVEKAGSIGVATALGDNKFYPGAKITREHVAIMTARLANALGKPLPKKATTYEDKSSISASALESVGQVQAAELMVEAGDKKFAPKDPYTREQSIATIKRIYDAMRGTTTESPKPTASPSGGRTLNIAEKELVGTWICIDYVRDLHILYVFKEDGTFYFSEGSQSSFEGHGYKATITDGKFAVSDSKLYFSELITNYGTIWQDTVVEYTLENRDKTYLYIARLWNTPSIGMKDAKEFHKTE